MKNRFFLLLIAIIAVNAAFAQKPEEIEAFQYLNKVRQNPSKYSSEIGADLSYLSPIHELRWNKKLYKAASDKAKDMAARGYNAHVDPDGYGMNYFINKNGYTLQKEWLDDKARNNFESCYRGGALGKDVVIRWINDGNPDDPNNAGHRKHIMGATPFWGECYDCAVAFASGNGSNYWCILVAKHHHYQKPDEDLIESDIVYFDDNYNDYSNDDDDDDEYYDDDDDDEYDDDDDDDWYDDDDDDDDEDWLDDEDDDDDDHHHHHHHNNHHHPHHRPSHNNGHHHHRPSHH